MICTEAWFEEEAESSGGHGGGETVSEGPKSSHELSGPSEWSGR